jgi:hypothetical protein
MQFGESYVARIFARVGEGVVVTRPWILPPKMSQAICVTARFTP